MKKFVSGAVILLIIAAMILSTIAVTANSVEEHFSGACVKADAVEEQNSFIDTSGIHNMDYLMYLYYFTRVHIDHMKTGISIQVLKT